MSAFMFMSDIPIDQPDLFWRLPLNYTKLTTSCPPFRQQVTVWVHSKPPRSPLTTMTKLTEMIMHIQIVPRLAMAVAGMVGVKFCWLLKTAVRPILTASITPIQPWMPHRMACCGIPGRTVGILWKLCRWNYAVHPPRIPPLCNTTGGDPGNISPQILTWLGRGGGM